MWRRTVLSLALGLGTGLAMAQQPVQTGYLVLRIKTAGDTTGAQPGSSPMVPGGDGVVPMIPGGGGALPGVGAAPMPMSSGTGTGANPSNQPADLQQSVVAVVHYSNMLPRLVYPRNPASQSNPPMRQLVTKYGTPFLFADNQNVELFLLPVDMNPDRKLLTAAALWARNGKPVKDGVELVTQALINGMVDEAVKYADQTVAAADARKTETQPVTIAKFLTAYKAMAPKLASGGIDTGDGEKWRERLSATQVDQSAHYALISWGDQSVAASTIKRRLEQLEANHKAFFLWHALSGVDIHVPQAKLVVVLADRGNSINRLRDAMDGLPIVSDSFFSPLHQLLVLSPERIDETGRNFNRIVDLKYREGWNRDELLKGIGPLLKKGETVLPVVEAMTYSLVDKVVEDAAAQAMISRDGSRQLYSASGLLPRHVILPEWVDHGTSNLFYKPKNPLYSNITAKAPTMTIGLSSGHGAANYVLHRQFRDFIPKSITPDEAGRILQNVLEDRYFDAVRDGKDIDPQPASTTETAGIKLGPGGTTPGGTPMGAFPGGSPMGAFPGGSPAGAFPGSTPMGAFPMSTVPGQPGSGQPGRPDPAKEKRDLAQKLDSKAQATSWALTFYLSKRRMPELIAFYTELGRMPRDMRLDRILLMRTFCKSFGLMNASNATEYDRAAFNNFAKTWIDTVMAYQLSGYDLRMEATPVNSTPSTTPGGGPGGSPMLPGGGVPMP